MPLPIKVGFVGLSTIGWAATTLAPSLFQPSLQDKYKLVAVSTTSQESAEASAKKHAAQLGHTIKAYYGSTSQIAADPEVDLVVVSVKPWSQKAAVLPVIEQKKNFFLEWPVGRSLQETIEIAEAVHKYGVRSIVGLQGRQSPVVKKVKHLVNSGAIGAIRSTVWTGLIPREPHFFPPLVAAENKFTLDGANGVTTLRLVAGPQLDPFTFTLGCFNTVNATAATLYPTATILDRDGNPTGETLPAVTPDHYTISGILDSGAIATIIWRTAYSSTPGRRHLLWEIEGEEGSIRIESDTSSYLNIDNPMVFLNGEKVDFAGADGNVLDILVSAWEAYAAGEESAYTTIDDAAKVHRFLDAVERSLEEGKTIVL
ncbi:hypothetical protein HYPSUDRAFT_203107 [Hypholoma sublateritium FD-334 SS-4]|uniref:Uncharacterized protein n=1 Tax=Hypholoma sublateritium (strain FD-334 SS-4) TaxID=945553 RepID=A0A0D2PN82_HYPSF|nr:hypothetical protein HYPSUDRAFT_203107 [Hypholoma sublateritium FD-334 SS-4]